MTGTDFLLNILRPGLKGTCGNFLQLSNLSIQAVVSSSEFQYRSETDIWRAWAKLSMSMLVALNLSGGYIPAKWRTFHSLQTETGFPRGNSGTGLGYGADPGGAIWFGTLPVARDKSLQ